MQIQFQWVRRKVHKHGQRMCNDDKKWVVRHPKLKKKFERQIAHIFTRNTYTHYIQGRIQDFKLGGALKKIAPSAGRHENC